MVKTVEGSTVKELIEGWYKEWNILLKKESRNQKGLLLGVLSVRALLSLSRLLRNTDEANHMYNIAM